MSEHIIKAASRKVEGKGASRRLRHAGQVPAVVYGGSAEPAAIQIEHNHLWLASQNEWFYASILDLVVDGKAEKALLRDMQRHPFKQQILHLDFQRVDANTLIKFNVPLHFVNQEGSPAGKTAGVVITHELNEVHVLCLPGDLPEFIEVDLADLKLGDIVHLSQLKLPKGVTIPELKLGKSHDLAVVIAKHGRTEEVIAAPSAEVPASKQPAKPADKKPAGKK
jgi:large subunit ribosomal protein L25